MKLELYKTLWGHTGSLTEAMAECQAQGLAGLEGAVPPSKPVRTELDLALRESGLGYIAEICTAGSYVPNRLASAAEHLDSLQRQAELSLELRPKFLTVIAGCDAWGMSQSVDFFSQALMLERSLGVTLSFETHRSRSLFNPWMTRDILGQLPGMKLTCDFSHWCVVCERLIDTEPDVLRLCASRAHHVHARVGYDQGPQVPHPAAPEYRDALEAHERWWTNIWENHASKGREITTMTPEFGPDNYLHTLPFTNVPVANLSEINLWMAHRQRLRFETMSLPHKQRTV